MKDEAREAVVQCLGVVSTTMCVMSGIEICNAIKGATDFACETMAIKIRNYRNQKKEKLFQEMLEYVNSHKK